MSPASSAGDPAAPDASDGKALRAKVLTVSDGVAEGVRDDRSGRALVERLGAAGYAVVDHRVSADGIDNVAASLRALVDGFHGLVVTTGGTGFGPRDLTPEGTRSVIERDAPGFAEAMRMATYGRNVFGLLSRAVCGTLGEALICNVPGSPGGAVECLEAVLDAVPHALDLLGGGRPH
jgi:molybdenum cofactor synthesis domain-containing protein